MVAHSERLAVNMLGNVLFGCTDLLAAMQVLGIWQEGF